MVDSLVLPSAGGVNYNNGEVNYIVVTDSVRFDNANRLLTHMVYRDNVLAAKINEIIAAMGTAAFSADIVLFGTDDVSPAYNKVIGSGLRATVFTAAENTIAWPQFVATGIVDTSDILFEITYNMSTSESTKQVSLNADVWVFNDGDAVGKAASATGLEDEISVPNDTQLDKLVLTNIKVPNAALTGSGQTIMLKLWRDVAGVAANHSGDFQLVSVRAYQA